MKRTLKEWLLSILVVSGLLILLGHPTLSALANSPVISTTNNDVIATKASAAVVEVGTYKNEPTYNGLSLEEIAVGSGFFVTADGYILTNNHVVVDKTATYEVSYKGNDHIPAKVVYRDSKKDLAIVKIGGNNYPTLPLGDSSTVRVGEKVLAIGNALGRYVDYTSEGNIVALNRNVDVEGDNGMSEKLTGMIQSSAKVYPGESGGPLLDTTGKVVAINTATTVGGPYTASFSVPINIAKDAISQAGIN